MTSHKFKGAGVPLSCIRLKLKRCKYSAVPSIGAGGPGAAAPPRELELKSSARTDRAYTDGRDTVL